MLDENKWTLSKEDFAQICTWFRVSQVDLFATSQNAQVPFFFFCEIQGSGGNGNGCTEFSMDSMSPLCLSTIPTSLEGDTESHPAKSQSNTHCATLTTETLVSGFKEVSDTGPMALAPKRRSLISGKHCASKPRYVATHYMEIERRMLLKRVYGLLVVNTMLSSRKESTHTIYNRTWQKSVSWCAEAKKDPKSPSIPLILDFLQSGLNKGLSPSTLCRQVAALSAALTSQKGESVAQNSHVKRFLRGVVLLKPPQAH